MAYEKHDWQPGEVITEGLLDHMEQGIADAQGATSIPTGALVPGTGIALDRDADTQAITVSVKAGTIGTEQLKAGAVNTSALLDGAVTAAKLAKGVIPAAYTLPAATGAALGGVKQAAAVADLAADATLADVVAKVNALLAAQRAAGQVAAK